MHESTVSRVTSNKYMMTPRGVFELKYFFSASIAPTSGGDGAFGRGGALSHQADDRSRERRTMFSRTTPSSTRLKASDIDIARRTVAKYRDSLRIPSSVDRRRAKLAQACMAAH